METLSQILFLTIGRFFFSHPSPLFIARLSETFRTGSEIESEPVSLTFGDYPDALMTTVVGHPDVITVSHYLSPLLSICRECCGCHDGRVDDVSTFSSDATSDTVGTDNNKYLSGAHATSPHAHS